MQISDLFGQYEVNTSANSSGAGNVAGSAAANASQSLADAMRMLPAGSVFEATVNEMENGEVVLGLSDGRTVSARLTAGISLNVGEAMFFQVKSNNGTQIEIRPFQTGPEGNPTLLKALDAAGLNVNDKNLTLVNTMMQEQMPIDKSSLLAMVRLSGNHPDVAPATLVEMTKLGLPVTEENAAAFENYKTDQNAMMKELNTLFERLPEMAGSEKLPVSDAIAFHKQITALLGGTQADGTVTVKGQETAPVDVPAGDTATGNVSDAAAFGKAVMTDGETVSQVIQQDGTEAQQTVQTADQNDTAAQQTAQKALQDGTAAQQTVQTAEQVGRDGNVAQQTAEQVEQDGNVAQQTAQQLGQNDTAERQVVQQDGAAVSTSGAAGEAAASAGQAAPSGLGEILKPEQFQELKSVYTELSGENTDISKLTPKQFLLALSSLLADGGSGREQTVHKLFAGKSYQQVLRSALEEEWLLKPQDIRDSGKMNEFYARVDHQMGQLSQIIAEAGGNAQTAQAASDLQNNINFMNVLNQTYTYMQIPLKMTNQNAKGDLYVYTNKRKLAEKDGELSAFLHLDMEHLGSTDVSVKMHGKSVSTKFYLAGETSWQIVSEHVPLLQQQLEKLGYQCRIDVENEEKKVDLVDDFLKRDKPSGGMVHRYSFDMRA